MNHLRVEILHLHFMVIKYSKIHIILVLRGRKISYKINKPPKPLCIRDLGGICLFDFNVW